MVCGAGHTEGLTTDGDLLAVGLVDNTVDLLEIIRVRDDLVVGDDILERTSANYGQRRVYCSQDMLAPAGKSGVFAQADIHAALAVTHLENDHGGGCVDFLKERSE